jgi:hypothetical protein
MIAARCGSETDLGAVQRPSPEMLRDAKFAEHKEGLGLEKRPLRFRCATASSATKR